MNVNPLGYSPQITEQAHFLATLPEGRTEYFPSVASHILSGGNWLPPSPVRNISRATQARKQTRKQRKVSRSRARHVRSGVSQPIVAIGVGEFDLTLVASIRDIKINKDYTVVVIQALVDPGVSLLLTLENQRGPQAEALQIKSISIKFEVSEHKPRSHFIASSLYAMLALAGSINIALPEMNIDVKVSFDLPLSEVSKFLQNRQTYYGLMVIERSTGLHLPIPEFITADDMGNISFAYHAIVARTFDWLANFITLPVPATLEILAWLDNLPSTEPGGSVYKVAFGPTPSVRKVFGQTISLGPEMVFIDDALVQNRYEVRRELAQLDGHEVAIVFRPRSGMGRYELSSAPRLPEQPWDKKIESFIRLEDGLNDLLATIYNNLAAATLSGFTPEEIESLTTRPEIDYNPGQTEE